MKCLKRALLLTIVIAVCSIAAVSTEAAQEKGNRETGANSREWEVLRLVNKQRLKAGEDPLTMNKRIQKAANIRKREIQWNWSHERPDGTPCVTALDQAGIHTDISGENIAFGQTKPSKVMKDWMDSIGHRMNILSESFAHVGIGYSNKNWVQLFSGGCTFTAIHVKGSGKTAKKGASLESMNLTLEAVCQEHGRSYLPLLDSMCHGYSKSKTGVQKVTVEYRGLKRSFHVVTGQAYRKPVIKKVTVKKKSCTIKWNKIYGASSYQVWYSSKKTSGYQLGKVTKKTKAHIKRDGKGKYVYFKVRGYRSYGGRKFYGPFGKVRTKIL